MEISQSVHLIEGVRGANCYLVTEPELALIDTGIPGQTARILSYVTNLGYNAGNLKRVILTHHDLDHIGSAAEIQRLTGADVCLHPADEEYVSDRVRRRPVWKARQRVHHRC